MLYLIKDETKNMLGQTKCKVIKVCLNENEVMMRCSCPSYRFRFDEANRRHQAGTGARFGIYHRKSDREPNNPNNIPGACKHIIEFITYLQDRGFITG